MAGKSARSQNRGNNTTLYGVNVSGKEVDYHTSEHGSGMEPSSWEPTSTLYNTQVFTSPASSVSLSTGIVEIIAVGGGGGSPTHPTPNPGGQGGISIARYNVPGSATLLVLVGGTGADGEPGPGDGGAGYDPTSINTGAGGPAYAAYPPGGSYGGTGGGGASGVFADSISQPTSLVVAGGGGGEAHATYGPDGGNGGGAVGGAGGAPGTGTGGGGGSNPTNAGGAAGADQPGLPAPSPGPIPFAGSALQGGATPAHFNSNIAYAGGGGGGGYWGGGGGGASSSSSGSNSAGGGGGSGFFATSTITTPVGDIEYYPDVTVERNYQGMGYAPGEQGTGGPYPLGAGKDHPQLSPLGTEYGNGGIQGYVIINFYQNL